MKSPFGNMENRAQSMQTMDHVRLSMEAVDKLRVSVQQWIEEREDADGCKCVLEELSHLDVTLFCMLNTMRIYGSEVTRHIQTIDNHEAQVIASGRLGAVMENAAEDGDVHH